MADPYASFSSPVDGPWNDYSPTRGPWDDYAGGPWTVVGQEKYDPKTHGPISRAKPNPFDQFDAPAGANPYDQFDELPKGFTLDKRKPISAYRRPDIGRIKGNLEKMIGQNAPESDLDAYLASEGFKSPEEFRAAVSGYRPPDPTSAEAGRAALERSGDPRFAPAQDINEAIDPYRVVGQFAQGHNDSWANALGYPVDLVNRGIALAGGRTSNEPVLGPQSFRNIFDYVATAPGRVRDAVASGSLSPFTESRTARFEPENRTESLANDVGRAAGMATSSILPARAIAAAAAPGSATQAVATNLGANPVAQTAATVGGAVAGNLTGDPNVGSAVTLGLPLAGLGVQRTFSAAPATNTQEIERRALLEFGRQNNLGPLTAGKITDSGKLQTYEGAINRAPIPYLGGRVKATEEAGRDAWQRALLEKAGITGETAATPEVIDTGKARLNNQFRNLTQSTTINVTPKFGMDLTGIKNEYGNRLFEDVQPGLMRRIDELAQGPSALNGQGNPTATLDGKTYQNIRSDLSRISGTATKPADRLAAGRMVEALDDMAGASMPKDQMADWRKARQQWRNLLAIEKSVTSANNAQTAVGNIPVARFGRESQGNPDLERYGQYGAKFVGEKMPYDTASRHGSIGHLVTGGLGALGGTAGAHGHLPINAYTLGAGAIAATPFAVDLGMNNPVARMLLLSRYRNASRSMVPPGVFGSLAAQQSIQRASDAQD